MHALNYDGVKYYTFEQWPSLKHGVFTRLGGNSLPPWDSLNLGGTQGDALTAVKSNHELVYEALNVNGKRACTVWLVHSADTVIVNGPVEGRRWIALADGMVTDKVDTPLVMRYADCVPILLHDPVKGVIGLAHAGWRGTVLGAGSSAVRTMISAYGCNPSDIQAGIGPSIGPDRYQVGEEVVQAVNDYYGETAALIHRDPSDGSAYFDLWRANALDLERAGVGSIEIAEICTAENTHEFYSHRAENGRTGRFGVVISL